MWTWVYHVNMYINCNRFTFAISCGFLNNSVFVLHLIYHHYYCFEVVLLLECLTFQHMMHYVYIESGFDLK